MSASLGASGSHSPVLAWGRLVRLSLAPSAAADIAAGVVLGAGTWPGGSEVLALIASSLAIYHGGMALNDWADRKEDARVRRDRPIPSGAIPAPAALIAGLALLVGGTQLARLAGPTPALLLTLVAGAAAFYDIGPRGPWLGPVLLALCRIGNFGAGVALGLDQRAAELSAPAAIVLAFYGLYVFAVSRLGRLEDKPRGIELPGAPGNSLLLAAAVLTLAPIAALMANPQSASPVLGFVAVALGGAAALPLARAALAPGRWTPERILPLMGMALRRLLIFSGACTVAAGGAAGLLVGVVILGGYPLSWGLRRVFPPS